MHSVSAAGSRKIEAESSSLGIPIAERKIASLGALKSRQGRTGHLELGWQTPVLRLTYPQDDSSVLAPQLPAHSYWEPGQSLALEEATSKSQIGLDEVILSSAHIHHITYHL